MPPGSVHRMGAGGSCSCRNGPRRRTGLMDTDTIGLPERSQPSLLFSQRETEAVKEHPQERFR